MDRDIRDRWVAALRGGEYRQARYALRDGKADGYCCLGVLCELYRLETGEGEWEQEDARYDAMRYLDGGGLLPGAVMEWAGLGSRNPEAGGTKLSYYNDSWGFTFGQIADLIEEEEEEGAGW